MIENLSNTVTRRLPAPSPHPPRSATRALFFTPLLLHIKSVVIFDFFYLKNISTLRPSLPDCCRNPHSWLHHLQFALNSLNQIENLWRQSPLCRSPPPLWNSLPAELWNAESLDIFKKLLKHHLFTPVNAPPSGSVIDLFCTYIILFYFLYCFVLTNM